MVLYAVWHFNQNIPGLRLWMLSFPLGAVFSASLLLRNWLPEVLAVAIAQASVSLAAYLCLIALIFVVINLVVDLLYFAVDPRLRVGKAGGH